MPVVSVNWTLLVATAVANLCMGIYVFSRSPRAPLNKAFGLLALATSLWAVALAIGYHVDPRDASPDWTTIVIRFAFAAGSMFALTFVLFIERFTLPSPKVAAAVRRGFIVMGVAFCGASFSPWIVVSARPEAGGLQVTYGLLHPWFAAYALVGLGTTVHLLVVKYRRSDGLEGLQVRYVILAFVLSGALITTTNVVLPLVLRTSAYGRYGPLFSLLLLGIIGHAIIRHRLLDVRIVIHRGATYLAALVITAGTLALGLAGANVFLPDEHDFSIREIGLALAVVFCLNPVRATVQRLFDRYLYRDPYDYARTLREASQALTATIDLQALLRDTGSVLESTFRPEGIGIYVHDADDGEFRLSWSSPSASFPPTLAETSSLVATLRTPRLVFRDEIAGASSPVTPRGLHDELCSL